MTTITTANNLVTLINVFTVEPEHQQRLVEIFVEAGVAMSKSQDSSVRTFTKV
jgi:hypothetical protein